MNQRRRTGILRTLLWGVALVAITLVVHLLYVAWPWPGQPRGVAALQRTVEAEWTLVSELADERSGTVIAATVDWTYRVSFAWTGLDELVRGAVQAGPEATADDAMRRFVLSTWMFWETVYWSVQLIGLRIGVLLVSLPLFIVAAVGGAADGIMGWYLRRTGGGRESGFIYHRAKFALWASVFILWAVYLVPPVPLDPRLIIPPFVLLFGIGIRVAVSWFKKYL